MSSSGDGEQSQVPGSAATFARSCYHVREFHRRAGQVHKKRSGDLGQALNKVLLRVYDLGQNTHTSRLRNWRNITMKQIISEMLKHYELGKVSRRQLIQTLAVIAGAA